MSVAVQTETQVSRKITRAKITKTSTVEVDFEPTITFEKEGKTVELTGEQSYKGRNIAHEDLINAFKLTHPHFAILCDLKEADDMSLHDLENDLQSIEQIGVRSFSIGGSGDSEGVTLSGFKKLSGGKMINFNTPFIKWEDESDPYNYVIELKHVIDVICDEVEFYLDGKIAPDAQLSMFDGTDEELDNE